MGWLAGGNKTDICCIGVDDDGILHYREDGCCHGESARHDSRRVGELLAGAASHDAG